MSKLLAYMSIAILSLGLIMLEVYTVVGATMFFLPLGVLVCGAFLGLDAWLIDNFS